MGEEDQTPNIEHPAPKSDGQEPLLCFLHIPKTAGLTLRVSVLARQYEPDEVFSTSWSGKAPAGGSAAVGAFSDELGSVGLFSGVGRPDVLWFPESLQAAAARYREMPRDRLARVRVFCGQHIEFGLHDAVSRPVSYFTLLREPVARVLSHYDFAHKSRRVPDGMSLPGRIAAHVEANLQTRLMAGPPERTASLLPDERLELAVRNLRSCAVVGLTERFDESLLMLKKTYGWRMPFYERRNVGKHRLARAAIPDGVIRQIEADNRLDAALYRVARELFEIQARRYGPALARDVRVFRFLNFWWRRWQAVKRLPGQAVTALDRYLFEPPYQALARWGGLRRLLPARLAPRVVSSLQENRLFFDLRIGRKQVGYFDPQRQRWEIRRPYHLLVDERALPGGPTGNP